MVRIAPAPMQVGGLITESVVRERLKRWLERGDRELRVALLDSVFVLRRFDLESMQRELAKRGFIVGENELRGMLGYVASKVGILRSLSWRERRVYEFRDGLERVVRELLETVSGGR